MLVNASFFPMIHPSTYEPFLYLLLRLAIMMKRTHFCVMCGRRDRTTMEVWQILCRGAHSQTVFNVTLFFFPLLRGDFFFINIFSYPLAFVWGMKGWKGGVNLGELLKPRQQRWTWWTRKFFFLLCFFSFLMWLWSSLLSFEHVCITEWSSHLILTALSFVWTRRRRLGQGREVTWLQGGSFYKRSTINHTKFMSKVGMSGSADICDLTCQIWSRHKKAYLDTFYPTSSSCLDF